MLFPTLSRVTFILQVEVGFKSRAFEPHPRTSRDDDSLFMLVILSSIHRHVGQPTARSRRTNICAVSLGIEGKTRAMGNRKPCIAHKNKVVAYIGEFRSRTQAEPQAGWGFDSFACMTSEMGCAEVSGRDRFQVSSSSSRFLVLFHQRPLQCGQVRLPGC